MECPNCHQQTPDNRNFCKHCGASLNENYKPNDVLKAEIEKLNNQLDGAVKTLDDEHRQHEAEKAEEKTKTAKFQKYAIILLTLFLFVGGISVYQYFNVDNDVETISAPNDVLSRLPGNYTLREIRNGEPIGTSKTAVLRKETSGYTFTIVTDYGPEHHRFVITSNNLLHSETLGDGEVTYKDAINKITITFKKDNFSWEFVK